MTTLQNYATHSFYIKFYPALLSYTGCEKATLIAGKLEYWFSNPKYVGGFYKFVEPCGHPLYRHGDSWSEELGVSRKLFAKAFDIIGIRYNSKSAYLRSEDKFQGKLYASYHDRKTNRTYFVRNHEFTSQVLNSLKTSYSSTKQRIKKSVETLLKKTPHPRPNIQEPLAQKPSPILDSSELSQGRSRNGDLGRSYIRGSSFIHKETSSLEAAISNSPSGPDPHLRKETEEMIKIWEEEVGELGAPSLSGALFSRLQGVLKEFFDGSLASWEAYCRMISSSKFLMGEAQNKFFKKAWVTWAINPENIERIKGGDFRLGDRQTHQDKKIEGIDREIRSVEYKKHQIELKIEKIKSEERQRRKEIVKDRIKNLSEQERHNFEQDFELHLEKENNSMTEEFRKLRWKGMFISAYFEGFVEEKVYAEVFEDVKPHHDEKLVQSSGLLELLDDVCHDLSLRQQKKRNLECESNIFKSKIRESQTLEHKTLELNIRNPNAIKPQTFELEILKPIARRMETPGSKSQEFLPHEAFSSQDLKGADQHIGGPSMRSPNALNGCVRGNTSWA